MSISHGMTRGRKRTLLAFLLLGQCLDALTFVLFYEIAPPIVGPTERNGVIVAALAFGGLAGVAALKIGLGSLTFVIGTVRWPSLNVSWRWMPAWIVAVWLVTMPIRSILTNVLFAAAVGSGFVGATFNAIAVARVL